jgi:hypothetical protein
MRIYTFDFLIGTISENNKAEFNKRYLDIALEPSLPPFVDDYITEASKLAVNSSDRRRPGRQDASEMLVPLLRGSSTEEANFPPIPVAQRPVSDLDSAKGVFMAGVVSLALWILAGVGIWAWW